MELPASLLRNADLLVQNAGYFVLEPFGLTEKSLFLLTLAVAVDVGWLVRLGRRLRRAARDGVAAAGAETLGAAALDASLRRPFAVLLVLHVGFYAFVARNYAHWYAATPLLIACIAHGTRLTPWLARARPGVLRPRRGRAGPDGPPSAIWATVTASRRRRAAGPSARTARRVGLLNAGGGMLLQLHARVRVINLDGLVNNAVTRCARRRIERHVLAHVDVLPRIPPASPG